MVEKYFSHPAAMRRLRQGPLAQHLEDFARQLWEQGYGWKAGRYKIRLVSHVSRWLQARKLGADSLDEQRAGEFLKDWRRQGRQICSHAGTLAAFIEHLRVRGALTRPAPQQASPIERFEQEFGRYLKQERGWAAVTLKCCLPLLRLFLQESFPDGAIRFDRLAAPDLIGFVLRSRSTAIAKHRVTLLRCLLRYLLQRGEIAADLAACLPSVAQWHLSGLPETLEPQEVESLLDSCPGRRPVDLRNQAMLRLLARLGLRAGEVCGLVLEDLDWDRAVLTVRGKGGREDRLPIPEDVGKALAEYLLRGRPACSARHLFIRAQAPLQGLTSSAVAGVVRQAVRRAGLQAGRTGAHLLRHSLACRMLRNGASLSEVGQILRHSLPCTTQIYAKVELDALRPLALPWPGGER